MATTVVYQTHPTVPEGEVISSDPPEGEDATVDADGEAVITIYMSKGPGKVRFALFSLRYNTAVFTVSR